MNDLLCKKDDLLATIVYTVDFREYQKNKTVFT